MQIQTYLPAFSSYIRGVLSWATSLPANGLAIENATSLMRFKSSLIGHPMACERNLRSLEVIQLLDVFFRCNCETTPTGRYALIQNYEKRKEKIYI